MYLDSESHSAFTGAPATVEPRPGAPFHAFDGQLTGTMLHIVPKRLIVQAWRSANWHEDAIDSTLVLSFLPEQTEDGGATGRIELVHVNVPDSDFAGVSRGGEKYYFTPWRAWFEVNSSS